MLYLERLNSHYGWDIFIATFPSLLWCSVFNWFNGAVPIELMLWIIIRRAYTVWVLPVWVLSSMEKLEGLLPVLCVLYNLVAVRGSRWHWTSVRAVLSSHGLGCWPWFIHGPSQASKGYEYPFGKKSRTPESRSENHAWTGCFYPREFVIEQYEPCLFSLWYLLGFHIPICLYFDLAAGGYSGEIQELASVKIVLDILLANFGVGFFLVVGFFGCGGWIGFLRVLVVLFLLLLHVFISFTTFTDT